MQQKQAGKKYKKSNEHKPAKVVISIGKSNRRRQHKGIRPMTLKRGVWVQAGVGAEKDA